MHLGQRQGLMLAANVSSADVTNLEKDIKKIMRLMRRRRTRRKRQVAVIVVGCKVRESDLHVGKRRQGLVLVAHVSADITH